MSLPPDRLYSLRSFGLAEPWLASADLFDEQLAQRLARNQADDFGVGYADGRSRDDPCKELFERPPPIGIWCPETRGCLSEELARRRVENLREAGVEARDRGRNIYARVQEAGLLSVQSGDPLAGGADA